MGFKVEIKNIGKLTDTKIQIGEFTIFAGSNNTGKSFVSKILYSLFNAANANHAESHFRRLFDPVRRTAERLVRREIPDTESMVIYSLVEKIQKMESLVKGFSIGESHKIVHPLLVQLGEMLDIARDILGLPLTSGPAGLRTDLIDSVIRMANGLNESLEILNNSDINKFISIGMKHEIEESLIQNFQIPDIDDIRDQENVPSKINIEKFGKLEFDNEKRDFRIHSSLVEQSWPYSRVVYLESPVYWKLKAALESVVALPGPFFSRERLIGVPGHFYDLAKALKSEYSGDIAFPDVHERLTGQGGIGGKITITEGGDLSFQENGHSFPLPITAMGATNLGILALLIERKILDKDTFLFIDEPEAHLHPAWQIVMAEALFELCRQGVYIVIATHSVDILKWLEVHIKKNPDEQELVALNHFPARADDTDDDFFTKISKIKRELTEPFSHLYLKGL